MRLRISIRLRPTVHRSVGPSVRRSVGRSIGPSLGVRVTFSRLCLVSLVHIAFFSRVLRDSTPRYVRPSVRRSVGPSVGPSVHVNESKSGKTSVLDVFLVACTRLYTPLCRSVCPSVRPSVRHTLLFCNIMSILRSF